MFRICTVWKNECAQMSILCDVVVEWDGCMLFERDEVGDVSKVETNQLVV